MNSSLNLTSDDLIGNIQKFNNYLIFKLNEQCVNINENVKEIINSTNDTSVNDTLLITTTTKTPNDDYDYAGAVVYIIVITLFYSISVLAIIRIQTKKRTDFNDYDDEDDYSNYRPETVLRRMKNENITRQVLGKFSSLLYYYFISLFEWRGNALCYFSNFFIKLSSSQT